jgi:hypothetical protein
MTTDNPDKDLETMDREGLLVAARAMRAAIREHRDSTGHNLCWHQPDMWNLLPDKRDPAIEVPEWPQFMRGCTHYRESLDKQAPNAPRVKREFKP